MEPHAPDPGLPPDPGEVTQLLQRWSTGDRSVEEKLFSLVLPDLRRLAGRTATTARHYLNAKRQIFKARFQDAARRLYYTLRPDDAVLWQLRLGLRNIGALVRRPSGSPYSAAHRWFVSAPVRPEGDAGHPAGEAPPDFGSVERPVVSVIIPVYNKIDLTAAASRVERDECGKISAVWISAKTGAGLDLTRSALEEYADAAKRRPVVRPAAA